MASEQITTSPKTLSHLQVVLNRLRNAINAAAAAAGTPASGTELEGTAAVALTAGDVVYAPTNGTFDQAVASALSTSQWIGVVTADASMAATATVRTSGIVEVSGWSLTVNTIYYLDPSTAGGITDTAPTTVSQVVVPVGIAVSATELRLLSETPVLL